MDYKNFVLEYYKNAAEGLHIQRVNNSKEAKNFHTHEYYQIYYIEKGSLMHFVEDSSAVLVVGDMFIVPPGVKHKIANDSDVSFYSISFMLKALSSFNNSSFITDFLINIKPEDVIALKISPSNDDVLLIENVILQCYEEFRKKKIGYGDVIKSYLNILISFFARKYHEKGPQAIGFGEDSRRFILHCVEHIETHFNQEITLDSMVQLSAMSKTKFCKEFSETTGYSFNKYLNICRIREAAKYIKSGYKISAIYGLCGYNDFSTFYRNFKKYMKISPLEYQKNHSA